MKPSERIKEIVKRKYTSQFLNSEYIELVDAPISDMVNGILSYFDEQALLASKEPKEERKHETEAVSVLGRRNPFDVCRKCGETVFEDPN